MGKTKLDDDGNIAQPQRVDRSAPKNISKETQEALADAKDELKQDSLNSEHTIRPSDIWKKQPQQWIKASDDKRRSLLCGLVFYDGITATKKGFTTLMNYFTITMKDLEKYMPAIKAADAARVVKIQRNQFQGFLLRDDQPNGKFFLGKQFAYQVEHPAHEGVEAVTSQPPAIIINEVKGTNQELRDELDAAVQKQIDSSHRKRMN